MGAAQRKKIKTAWHEAGHIVVGTHFNLKLARASIIPRTEGDGLSDGRTEWESIGENVMPLVCQALAGQAVEERIYGPKGYHGDRDDQAIIQALAWVYKANNSDYTPPAEMIPRLTAVYRERPDRVPLEVRRIADEMVKKAMLETVPGAQRTLERSRGCRHSTAQAYHCYTGIATST